MGSKNQQAVNPAAVAEAIKAEQAAATAPVGVAPVKGTLHTQNPEVRMFQILKVANSKTTGNEVCFASEPFKGGGWKADDSVAKIMGDVGHGVTAIVGRNSIVYYNARNPRPQSGSFQKAG